MDKPADQGPQNPDLKSEISDLKSDTPNQGTRTADPKSGIPDQSSGTEGLKSDISNLKSQISDLKSPISDAGSPTPDSHPHAHPAPHRTGLRRVTHAAKEIIIRFYALLVMIGVLYPAYKAVSYVQQQVFSPQPVPRRFLDWQGRIDADALRAQDVPGVTGEAPRAPLGHYHRLERWFQPDPTNGCTSSGCHDPLPHSKKMKVPAFANFHTTFLACQMCHTNGHATAAWISTADGRDCATPPLLRLMRYLDDKQDQIKSSPAEAHKTIVDLLRQSLAVAGTDPALSDLLLQFETSDPLSPVWRRAMDRMALELPLHARGEYGAKITRQTAPGAHQKASAELAAQTRKYFGAAIVPAQRSELHKAIHAPLIKDPLACISCYRDGTLDFEALGYSPRRAKTLSKLQLASLMQQIREGQQFYIPKLLESGDGQ